MDTCTVETGLLSKKPCGHAAVTHCANCEQPLCSKHAVAQFKENGLKSGKFLCKDCEAARAEVAKLGPTPQAAKPAAPVAGAPPKEEPPKGAPGKEEAPSASKPADDGGALEFTPSNDKK